MVYYNWRYYNEKEGRWLRQDPANGLNYGNLYVMLKNQMMRSMDYLGREEITMVEPPEDEIFYFPTVNTDDKKENPLFITREQVLEFGRAVASVANKRIKGKTCYNISIYYKGAATKSLVLNASCDIIFIIGHGEVINGQQYIYLKDGPLAINKIKGKECVPIGCYIGENKGKITLHGALDQLINALYELANNDKCPGKNIRIFSGPLLL